VEPTREVPPGRRPTLRQAPVEAHARAVAWAVDALRHDDTAVAALARHLAIDWHTAWEAGRVETTRRRKDPETGHRRQGAPG